MKIIVTGHGNFASGFQSTVKLLAGEIAGLEFIDFTENMSEEDLLESFPHEDNLLFFCDLAGGTPYKEAVLLSTQYQNVSVMAGGNIAALLEVGLQNNIPEFEDSQELLALLLESSHSGIQSFEFKVSTENSEETEDDYEDGI